MIDHVRLRFDMAIPRAILNKYHWVEFPTVVNRVKIKTRYSRNFKGRTSGGTITAVYYPNEHLDNISPLLNLEFSMPKLLFGENVSEISNINVAVAQSNTIIAQVDGIPAVEIGEGILNRIDICYNHQVGNNVSSWLSVLRIMQYPHRKTITYGEEGVVFMAKSVQTKFYDKSAISISTHADGILRQETTIKKAHRLGNILRSDGPPTLNKIDIGQLRNVLSQDLERLGIRGKSIYSQTSTLDKLHEIFTRSKADRLFGTLQGIRLHGGFEQYYRDMGWDYQTKSRFRKDLKKAGIPPSSTDMEEKLPPLSIESFQKAEDCYY